MNRTLPFAGIDWNSSHVNKLWTYNLHYFDYAVDLAWAFNINGQKRYVETFETLIQNWSEGAKRSGPGWEPYPTSVRLVNWVFALALLRDALSSVTSDLILRSIFDQGIWLEKRIEYHLLGNHVLKNLYALSILGFIFEGRIGHSWRSRHTAGLWRQVDEQFLSDGGHYERSPMYHTIALTDLLHAAALSQACDTPISPSVLEKLQAISSAAGKLTRADGSVHLLQDSANGIVPHRDYLDRLSTTVHGRAITDPEGAWAMSTTGYYGLAFRTGERFVADCGEPGPEHQPGHSHCSLLSFELDHGGTPAIVDSGVSGYDADPLRDYARSTRAHNTVTIGELEQSEMWGTFRIARRAKLRRVKQWSSHDSYVLEGAYSPYHSPAEIHERKVEHRGGRWTISDRVTGALGKTLRSFLHFHPSFSLELHDDLARAIKANLIIEVRTFGVDSATVREGELKPAQGWYCPEFGRSIAAPTLEMVVSSNSGERFGYEIRFLGVDAC